MPIRPAANDAVADEDRDRQPRLESTPHGVRAALLRGLRQLPVKLRHLCPFLHRRALYHKTKNPQTPPSPLECLSACGGERPNGTSGRKGRHALRPPLSTIMRLRSGAVASRGIPFRRVRSASGPFSATVGTGAPAWRGVAALAARATRPAYARAIHPPLRGGGLGRNTSRRPSPTAPAAPGASSRPRALPLASAPSRPLRAGRMVAFPAARVPRALLEQ